jgi:hypothetical protein
MSCLFVRLSARKHQLGKNCTVFLKMFLLLIISKSVEKIQAFAKMGNKNITQFL